MIKLNVNKIAALFAFALLALTARANAQMAFVSGSGAANGAVVACSMQTYVTSGKVNGTVSLQFPGATYQGTAVAISSVYTDSKGTETVTVETIGSLAPTKGATVRVMCAVTLVQAPGSKGSFTVAFNQYVIGQTITANMAAPGPVVQTGIGIVTMKAGGVTIRQ